MRPLHLAFLVALAAVRPVERAVAAPAALPDTVLAEVAGPGEAPPRVIGRGEFGRAWTQAAPPARPDSLTPADARRFLDLLIDKEAIERMAARERWTWTARESASHRALADRLVMDATLREELAATRRALGPAADSTTSDQLPLAARDRAVAALAPAWDDALLARLARAFEALPRPSSDSSLTAQLRVLGAMPAVPPADTGAVLARTAQGDYRVPDLLAMWGRVNPLQRPRVDSAEQVRDLVRNGLFERMLRRRADSLRTARRPEIVARLETERRLFDVSHLVEREVYARIPADSVTLQRHYARTRDDWALPTRVRLLRMEVDRLSEAATLAGRLAQPAEAESLAADARRQRLPWLVDLSAAEDDALFARALRAGTGAVLGPEQAGSGWRVMRVMAVLPGRPRAFGEVRELVRRAWVGEDGERRMRELLARARAQVRVRVNEAALAALATEGIPVP